MVQLKYHRTKQFIFSLLRSKTSKTAIFFSKVRIFKKNVILGPILMISKFVNLSYATITRCDLSPRLFCICTLLCEFGSDTI